jgi:hypothetical protein
VLQATLSTLIVLIAAVLDAGSVATFGAAEVASVATLDALPLVEGKDRSGIK